LLRPILLAPDQCFTDDFVLIRASEIPEKSLASLLLNESSERADLRTSPSVQLDQIVTV